MTLGRCRGHVTLITLEVVAQLGARQDRALTSSFFPPNFLKSEDNYFTILWWFCRTSTWISIMCVCPSFLTPPPPAHPILQVATERRLWVPTSYIELPLAVCLTRGNV